MSKIIDTGGPAFPNTGYQRSQEKDGAWIEPMHYPDAGMTLRDYFAGQIMAEYMSAMLHRVGPAEADVAANYIETFGRAAYYGADVMLKVRKEPS